MKKSEKEINILSLSYSRYISRAHTTISTLFEAIIGITLGFFGVYFAYSELLNIKPDKFKLLALGEFCIIIIGIFTFAAFYIWYDSRIQRKEIVKRIRALN